MLGIADYGAFCAAILLFLALPGPGTFALLTSTGKGGFRAGAAATLGVIVGDQVLLWLAVAGVAALLAAHPVLFKAVQYSGAAYLALDRPASCCFAAPGSARPVRIEPRHYARQAFLITLLNPKAIVFYMAFFPLFIDPATHRGAVTFAAMAATIAVITAVYCLTAVRLCRRRQRPGQGAPAAGARARTAGRRVPGRLRHPARARSERMTRIFCIANQKGGVGKTTTTVNLAAGLAQVGQRVLVVDLDPQGNATMGSGIDKRALDTQRLRRAAGIGHHRRSAPAQPQGRLRRARRQPRTGRRRGRTGRTRAPREAPARTRWPPCASDYDFVLIDCPPSLSLLTLNGLCAAHGVIVPMQCEYFALEGLSDLVNTIKQVHANLNPDLQIIGLLRVMFDPRITLQQQVSEQLKAHFGDKVFDTVIPRNVRLAEAPSYGQPGVIFDPASKGAHRLRRIRARDGACALDEALLVAASKTPA